MTDGTLHATLGDLLKRQADTLGDKTFLTFEGHDYSYDELDRRTNRVANAMRARLGIEKGDHVGLFLGNHPQFLFAIGALAKLGAVAVPLNTAAKGELLDYFLRQSKVCALIVDQSLMDRSDPVTREIDRIRTVVVVPDADGPALPNGVMAFADLEQGAETRPENAVDYRDPMFLMYTSGTTGPSKGVVSPHAQGLSIGQQLVAAYGYTGDDVIYTCLPLFHGNALWYSTMPALVSGAHLVLSRRFSGSGFWDELTACGATQANALGAMANIALKEIRRLDRDRLKLRQMMVVPALDKTTAAPLTDGLGLKITSLFAQTETFAVTLYGPDEPEAKIGSAGRVRDHVTIAILDDEDRALPAREIGEIAVRPMAPGIMMLGYYQMPEETLETMSTLWFHTGDRGYLDEDGYLYFVDRKKDAIRRRGENISAYELEMILSRHPAVREAAAVAVPSELGEDDVLVYIVTEPGADADLVGIIEFCNTNMPYFMVPRYLKTIEELPKTSSEKIEKYKLRQWANDDMAALWDREAEGIELDR